MVVLRSGIGEACCQINIFIIAQPKAFVNRKNAFPKKKKSRPPRREAGKSYGIKLWEPE